MITTMLWYFRQAPILIPFLIVAGVLLVGERNGIIADWRAMYPTDPREKTAIQLCYIENHQFNRMSDEARKGCYERWLPRIPVRFSSVELKRHDA
jgi:hypothetical protein